MKKSMLLLLLFLTACNIEGISQKPPVEENNPLEVYFCEREDCESFFSKIASDSNEIKCAIYNLDLEQFISALEKAQVVTEDQNFYKIKNKLDSKGEGKKGLMHNKFCVFNGEIVWTGSLNPTEHNVEFANNVVVFHSKFLAENYLQEFNELWDHEENKKVVNPVIILNGKRIENYFCPEDKCKDKIIGIIENAEESIYFMHSSFTDEDIGGLILKRAQEGLEVRGIFDKGFDKRWSEYPKLNGFSVLREKIHHKVFIIDEAIVITGSMNPSRNGNEMNDENIVIIHDKSVAKKYLEEFEFALSST